MQEFLRRNFWTVNLVVLAIGAYLAASVASEVATMVFLKTSAAVEDSNADPASEIAVPIKPESSVSLETTLLERNLFDAEPKVVEEGEFGEDGEPIDDGGGAGEELSISVELLGTLVSNNRDWSLATVKFSGESQLVRIGMKINDQVEVVDIAGHYIVLQEGAKTKIVKLWDDPTAAPNKGPGKPAQAAVGVSRPGPKHGGEDFAKGVRKRGPYDYQIDRNMLEENLQDLTKLGMQARIVPNYEAGKYHGFRLVGVRPDSLYKAIGLQSGDLISRINGQDIDTPNKAIQLFEELRSSSQISLDMVRRGEKVTMAYSIK